MGFSHVGEIEPSYIFRDLPQRDDAVDPVHELLGEQAITFIDELEESVPSKWAKEITEQSEEEVTKGYASGLFTRDELDTQYGRG